MLDLRMTIQRSSSGSVLQKVAFVKLCCTYFSMHSLPYTHVVQVPPSCQRGLPIVFFGDLFRVWKLVVDQLLCLLEQLRGRQQEQQKALQPERKSERCIFHL